LRHTTAQQWEETMRVNSTGVFLASQIFSEPMQVQRSGSIVNISSIYGVVGPDFSIYEGTAMSNPVDYSFAKGGIIGFTRYLASFLGPFGVRANCISPGGFHTPDMPENFQRNYTRRTLLGRMATADDIKGPALFLASDASAYVTGQNISVDGGWTAI
jgi:NAD(P)-dependent dehydrogenase (short-subunit alcohol dehydrogenase family)